MGNGFHYWLNCFRVGVGMIQQDLLSDQPIARNTDPATSHKAADEITKSGKRATQQNQILEALATFQNCTSAELAQHMGLDRYIVARRLPELRPKHVLSGNARKCKVTGKSAMTWRLK